MTLSALRSDRSASGLGARVLAPVGFLVAYLAVSPLADAFADRPLPLPGSPASEVVAYYAANPVPVGITAVLQVLSVAFLAVFVAALAPALRAAGAAWPALFGYLSAAAMVVSSALSVTLAVIATSVSETTVEVLRQASFYAGGVVTVVTLGLFVVGTAAVLGRERLFALRPAGSASSPARSRSCPSCRRSSTTPTPRCRSGGCCAWCGPSSPAS